jgi:hypothetical protein
MKRLDGRTALTGKHDERMRFLRKRVRAVNGQASRIPQACMAAATPEAKRRDPCRTDDVRQSGRNWAWSFGLRSGSREYP